MALEKWGDEKHQKYGLLRGLDQLFQVGIVFFFSSWVSFSSTDCYVVCGEYSCCAAYSEVSNTEHPHLRGWGLWVLERDAYDC